MQIISPKQNLFRTYVAAGMSLLILLASGATVGCSDGNESDSGSGVDPSKKLSAVSDAELGELCDWLNAEQGGYGVKKTCPDGGANTAESSQMECKAVDGPVLLKCDQTVAVYESCIRRVVKDLCHADAGFHSPECRPLLPCLPK